MEHKQKIHKKLRFTIADIPILPRQIHPVHNLPLDRHRRRLPPLRPAHLLRPRLVHRSLQSRDLPAEPVPGVHLTEIRPGSRERREPGGRGVVAADQEQRGVQTVRAPVTRVQVLVQRDARHRSGLLLQLE